MSKRKATLTGDVREHMLRPEAAAYVRLSEKTLANWACSGEHIPFYKLGKRVIYKRSDLDAFIASKATGPVPN